MSTQDPQIKGMHWYIGETYHTMNEENILLAARYASGVWTLAQRTSLEISNGPYWMVGREAYMRIQLICYGIDSDDPEECEDKTLIDERIHPVEWTKAIQWVIATQAEFEQQRFKKG